MEEFSAAILLALTEQTKITVAENKRRLLANSPMLTHFLNTKVFNDNLESHRVVFPKRLRWVMQF
jgi:hypothetical protein